MTSNRKKQEARTELVREFAVDVLAGLSSGEKFLPSRYFYDRAGSELFEQICIQPEYYPTRTEAAILDDCSPRIAQLAQTDDGISIIELGSGSSAKTRILLRQVLAGNKVSYFPIDISHAMLQETALSLMSEFQGIKVIGIPGDYKDGMKQADKVIAGSGAPQRRLVLFLGSSIGNFEPEQAVSFLRMVGENMRQGDLLLVGFDLHKDGRVLHDAYNDRNGVTAKFNLNLLHRINTELHGQFDIGKFDHMAFYNRRLRRIEMHLVSRADQEVYVGALDRSFRFAKGETIHTENSYKYSMRQIQNLAEDSGFVLKERFTDGKKWFCLALLARKVSQDI